MKIGLVTCYTPQIKDLAELLCKNKEEYCNRHNYIFCKEYGNWNDKQHDSPIYGFYKIHYLLRLLTKHPEIDWFFWIDSDAFVMNFNIKLEQFIDNHYDLIIGEDWNGINIGGFFLKNNIVSQQFLQKVWNFKPPEDLQNTKPKWWWQSEQGAISCCKDILKYKLVHHSLFNGYLTKIIDENDWRPFGLYPSNIYWKEHPFQIGDFILHLAGCENQLRMSNALHYLDKVVK